MTNAPHNDDLFQNRLSEMLRGLNGDTYETDDAIEAQLDAVAAQADGLAPAHDPLTDDEVARVLQKTRELIRHSDPSAVPRRSSASRTSDAGLVIAAPVRRSEFSSQNSRVARRVSLVGAVLALLLAVTALFEHEAPKTGPTQAVAGGPALKLSELFHERDPQATSNQVATPKLPDVTLQIGESISTGPRERLRVGLPDGSVAFLNADSLLVADSARRFSLPQGEAFFEVQPVEETGPRSEPFLVTAAGRTVTAVGTKFAVDAKEGNEAKVVVTQGSVRLPNVEPLIAAGQEVSFDITNANDIEQVGFPAVQPSKRASETLFWTRELISEAAPDIVPASEHRGGSITVVDPNGQEMKLSMRKFHVDVHIEDGFARTTIDQTYFNHTFSRQEGTFHFPLPPDASLSRLAMYVNGKLMEGGMVERNHGRNVYEQIRHTRRDPALLEWVDGSTFKMRVFPLEARREKRIVLSYTQRLPKNYDRTTYRFPAGHTMDGVRDWSTRLRIVDGKSAGLHWFSPSHLLRVIEPASNDDLILEGSQQNAAFDRDLVVELEVDASFQRSASPRWTTARADGAQYVLLRYQPELPAEMIRPKRNWVFVVETSADRNEVLRNAQREALRTLLDNAEHDDTFALVLAATRSSSFKAKPVFCTAKNVESALAFLDEEASLGALDLVEALKTSERFCRSESVENWIVHIGSGVGVIGRRDEQTLRDALPPKARYAGIGVGHRWNQAFMRDAASRTGGHFTQINPDEEVSWRAFEFLSALNAPRLLDLKVTSDQKDTTFLTFAETIAHGQEIAAVARFNADAKLPESITLSGTVDGEPWQQKLSLPDVPAPKNLDDVSNPSHYLPRSWAKLEIDRLIAVGAEQHRTAITELSKSMYVMSPFTSLLVLEDEAMYQQFNVDRGRKDHWALYPAPEKIEVVYEPGYSGPQPVDSLERINEKLQTATDELDAAQSNLQTAEEADASAKQLSTLNSQLAVAQSKVDRLSKYRVTLQKLRDDELLNVAKPIVDRKSGWNVYMPANQRYLKYFGRAPRQRNTFLLGVNALDGVIRTDAKTRILGENSSMELWYFRPSGVARNNKGIAVPSDGFDVSGLGVPLGWWSMPLNWDDSSWGLSFERNASSVFKRDAWRTEWIDGRVHQRNFVFTPVLDSALSPDSEFFTWTLRQPIARRPLSPVENGDVPQIALRYSAADDMVMSLAPILLSDDFDPRLVFGDLNENGVTQFDALLFDDIDGRGLTRELIKLQQPAINTWAMQNVDRFGFERLGRRPELLGLNRQLFESPASDVDFFVPPDGFAVQPMFELPVELVDREVTRRRRFTTSSWNRQQFGVPVYAVPPRRAFEKQYVSLNDPATASDEILQFRVRGGGASDEILNGQHYFLPPGLNHPNFDFDEFDFEYVPQPEGWEYRFPHQHGLISDPIERCRGMDTLAIDRQAAIDAAAEKEGMIVRGTVSPEAAKLIEKARARGWESVSVPGAENLTVVVNGAGQFRIERTLTDGLREVILCDGKSVWHLYPDFAVGARRDARLIADAILQSLIPWYIADVDTLGRRANVELIDEHTIRITPLINEKIAKAAKNLGREEETPLFAIELVFDDEGRLQQKRVVDTRTGNSRQRLAFLDDGTVVTFVGDSRMNSGEKFGRTETEAPELKPDSEFFTVLPLPYREADKLDIPPLTEKEDGKTDFSKLSQADALKLGAAYYATGKGTDLYQVMEQCFFAKGDYPLGFATLLHSKNPREVTAIQTATSRHPNHPLAQYLRQAAEWNVGGNPAIEFKLPEDASRYLKMIASTHNIYGRWSSGMAYKDRTGTQVATRLSADLKTVTEVENSSVVWVLLKTIAGQLPNVGDAQPFLYRKLASTAASLEEWPGQFTSARVQRVKWLLKAGAGDDAAKLYAEFLLREADSIAKRGGVVLLDSEVHESLDRGKWQAAVRAEAGKLIGNEAPLAVITLAEACLLVEEVELADELFASVFDEKEVESSPRLAAVALPFLTKRERHAEAERCFQTLLSQAALAANSSLWRHASTNAKALGDLDEAARRLEHALQLEFDRLPEQINVEQFRTHYNAAFDLLAEAVADAQNTESPMPGDLAGRIRELGDRWRSIDPDATQPCFRTARLLSDMGLPFDAWDYWTSPLASVPNNSGAWSSLANELGSRQQIGRASMAWDEAFVWESTNPDYLLSHAKLLSENGQLDKADSLLRQIAEDKWQPRFQQTKKSASELQQALKLAN